jgi:hypothetical protein
MLNDRQLKPNDLADNQQQLRQSMSQSQQWGDQRIPVQDYQDPRAVAQNYFQHFQFDQKRDVFGKQLLEQPAKKT